MKSITLASLLGVFVLGIAVGNSVVGRPRPIIPHERPEDVETIVANYPGDAGSLGRNCKTLTVYRVVTPTVYQPLRETPSETPIWIFVHTSASGEKTHYHAKE